MRDLAEFLLARLAEDEENTRACYDWTECGPHRWEDVGAGTYGCPAHPSVARHLVECEVKRRIVELHALARTMGHQCVAIDGPTQHHMADPCATLRLLSLPYADHPDYRAEWRP